MFANLAVHMEIALCETYNLGKEDETMDNEGIWCRTVLTAYRVLEHMAKVLDRTLEKMALSGFNKYNLSGFNTDSLYSKMLEVIDRKKGLINIKVLVDTVLASMPNKEYSVLYIRFVEGIGAERTAELLDMPKRTYFRCFNKALSTFAFQLKLLGYGAERFKTEYKNEPFIVAIYEKLLKKFVQSS